MAEFERKRRKTYGNAKGLAKVLRSSGTSPRNFQRFREMPKTMKQLAVVQFFTWLGLVLHVDVLWLDDLVSYLRCGE